MSNCGGSPNLCHWFDVYRDMSRNSYVHIIRLSCALLLMDLCSWRSTTFALLNSIIWQCAIFLWCSTNVRVCVATTSLKLCRWHWNMCEVTKAHVYSLPNQRRTNWSYICARDYIVLFVLDSSWSDMMWPQVFATTGNWHQLYNMYIYICCRCQIKFATQLLCITHKSPIKYVLII